MFHNIMICEMFLGRAVNQSVLGEQRRHICSCRVFLSLTNLADIGSTPGTTVTALRRILNRRQDCAVQKYGLQGLGRLLANAISSGRHAGCLAPHDCLRG